MKTKERILDAAIQLFNTQGTGEISTNHIAEAAGISPGNLYYHYGNKEAIIRAIFERLFARTDAALVLSEDHLPTLDDVQQLVRLNFQIMSEYQFIYREIIALLRQDADLSERYREVRERGYTGFREIIAALAQSGVMRSDLAGETITGLADLCWLISEFWLSTIEITGQAVDETQMQRGIDLMMLVLRPYFT